MMKVSKSKKLLFSRPEKRENEAVDENGDKNMMKRFSEISKSSLVRHWFDELPVGARFCSIDAAEAVGLHHNHTSSAIWYLFSTGACEHAGKEGRFQFYKKLRNSEISDHSTKHQPERTIVRRKMNVLYPQPFTTDENARLILAANRALKDQLKAKMEEILTTLSEIDELLKDLKSE